MSPVQIKTDRRPQFGKCMKELESPSSELGNEGSNAISLVWQEVDGECNNDVAEENQ